MTIILVEKEKKSLASTEKIIRSLEKDAEILCFDSSPKALAIARKKPIDIAFLDVRLKEMDGLILGRYLKALNPKINLIYLTDERSDAFDAMEIRASGCILMPTKKEKIQRELSELRNTLDKKGDHTVFAHTFGNFELFVDGKPVEFKYSKTKEILALLINNRGAQTTNGEIIASLWEDDDSKTSYLSNLRQDLQNTLTDLGISNIITKMRGSMGIVKEAIECDMYDWLEKKKKSRYQYLGEYMNQYSWAEYIHAELDEISYGLDDE